MSYILDALKKAEKERKRGTVPDLSTMQDPPPQKQKKRSLWPYLVIAALLINAGIFLIWLSPWETEETTSVAQAPPAITRESQAKASPQVSSENQFSPHATSSSVPTMTAPTGSDTLEEKSSREHQAKMTSKVQTDTHQQKEKRSTHVIQKDPSHEESPQKQPSEPSTSAATPPLPVEGTNTSDHQRSSPDRPSGSLLRLYDLKDLPSSVKDTLPDINISVFVYSDDPSSRIVKINGQSVREGQELTDGLKVERIVPEGVIFYYEGYRFRFRIR
jgi:general secretion pathway protein B